MQKMGLNEIREKYLEFFEKKDHLRLPSFSLIPKDDPSILLINAGMTPLKPYFSGKIKPPAPRVTTCQKCIRTPDIERVGKTSRHGTFFEMLGNFSFGDYFKKEAISWAWEFCVDVLNMPVEKLSVTVFHEDEEAYDIWHNEIGLPENKIFKMGKEDNFWEHGTGPCGPCSELFFDRGVDKGCKSPDCNVGCDCDRFVEFWNLVFTQFNKEEDGSYTPLEKKNIDTGGGLERFACIMQDVDNLFEVDTVRAILDYVCERIGVEYGKDSKTDVAIRVITDHIRSTVMMISDGILPDNGGRGYILRRLLRRASRYARILGMEKSFLFEVASVVIKEFEKAYPKLKEKEGLITRVILKEEENFAKTIASGSQILNDYIEELKKSGKKILSGEVVFKIHDTYGFPVDLTREIAAESGCSIDYDGFVEEMNKQKRINREDAMKKRGGEAWGKDGFPEEINEIKATTFIGYESLETNSTIEYILKIGEEIKSVEEAGTGEKVVLIGPVTPFYAQSGGQTGDKGIIEGSGFSFNVENTTKTPEGVILHTGVITDGVVAIGAQANLTVNRMNRLATARNHTATHILHKALKEVLGEHVAQAGSDVSVDRLRFDFSHFEAMSDEEIMSVEKRVNDVILADYPVTTNIMSIEEARKSKAVALFDEKYGDNVRVVSVGDYSQELCGGTHLDFSSTINLFRIVSESALAAGVRRIEGVTGKGAIEYDTNKMLILNTVAQTLKTNPLELNKKALALTAQIKSLEKKIESFAKEKAVNLIDEIIEKTIEVNGIKALFMQVESDGQDSLRNMADLIRDRIDGGVVLLASIVDDKVLFVCMAGEKAIAKGAHAGNVIKAASKAAGGGGGGRPDMAQAGAKDKSAVKLAIEAGKQALENMLK